MTAGFQPSHLVPEGGQSAWASPDPTLAPVARLDPRLPVQVLETRGSWAHFLCSNGWSAWADVRLLVPVAPPAYAPAPPPPPPLPPPPLPPPPLPPPPFAPPAHAPTAPSPGTPSSPPAGMLGLAGAAAVLLGSFLPWYTAGSISVSAWKVSLVGILSGGLGDSGVRAGVALLVPVVLVLPLLTSRPLPLPVVLGVAAVAVNLGGVAIVDSFLYDPHISTGVGVYVTAAGGLLVLAEAMSRARLLRAAGATP